MLFKIAGLSTFLILMAFSGCSYPSDFQHFSELPRDRQAETLKHLPIDRQIDFELVAQSEEPADTSVAQTIASEGDIIIPDVLRRFKSEAKDYKKVDLLQIFSQLCLRGRCAREQPELIEELEAETAGMPEGVWKEMARQDVFNLK